MSQSDSAEVLAIKARYRRSMGDKAKQVAQQLNALQAANAQATHALRQSLHDDLHKLAGSSGMYGYHDIAQCAQHAMIKLAEHNLVDLEQHLAELQMLLEHHAQA